jgi:MFS family permease
MVDRVIRGPRAVLALLTALNLLNYLDRFVVSAVLERIKSELSLSGWWAGNLFTVFLIGYFATSPVFGAWADRVGPGGRKRLIALGIAIRSLATVASGLSRTVGALIAARALVGVGEASYATIAPTIIDDIAPPERRGRWLAIFYAALPVGSALGYLVGGAVETATHSWRAAFWVAGGPGIVLAFVCLFIAEPVRRVRGDRPSVVASARGLLAIPVYRRAVAAYCAYTFAIGGFGFWAPYYLHVRYGVATGRASFAFGLVTVAGGAVGTLLGGWLGDRATRGRRDDPAVARAALSVCTLSAGLGAPLAALAIGASSANGFYAVVFPCEIALFLLGGPFNVAILSSVPSDQRASAMALGIFASHLLGDLWSPPLMGLVADHAPVAYAMLLVPVAFALAAFGWWRAPVRLT